MRCSLRDTVRRMTITLLLRLKCLRVETLLGLIEVWSCCVEGLRREHIPAHHGHLAGVGLEMRTIGLQLVTWELLVEEHVSDAVLRGNVVVQLAIEQPRGSLEVGVESLVLSGQVIVFLFVHFLVDNILLGDAQSAASALLVDLGSATGRFDASLKTAVASARGSYIGTGGCQHGSEDSKGPWPRERTKDEGGRRTTYRS